ncbi:hypothetical protein PsYK624_113560 [Phanerochaete sordida]|uniref:Uncharacterized protein n=1 Tax=Phanerochaete sordida TaxID=48140 RepID=A0A9P3GKF9_9APHY|nr:hypothetical protein PsYK624_113560 [Phanerochaete sordida]
MMNHYSRWPAERLLPCGRQEQPQSLRTPQDRQRTFYVCHPLPTVAAHRKQAISPRSLRNSAVKLGPWGIGPREVRRGYELYNRRTPLATTLATCSILETSRCATAHRRKPSR